MCLNLSNLIIWYNILAVVEDIVCVRDEFYVYDAEDCVKWFALLSVKECVSRLYEMGEFSQCLKVSNLSQAKLPEAAATSSCNMEHYYCPWLAC